MLALVFSEIPNEEIAAALDACATDVLWGVDIKGPPVDAFDIADRLELAITRDESMPHRARFVRLAECSSRGTRGQGAIVVGRAERPERAQWAVAHEIGESVAHRVFELLHMNPSFAPAGAREWVANRLACCLLLPMKWFNAYGLALDWDLLALKRRFATASHELIARRMLDMPPVVMITLCDLGKVRWRRSNVSSRTPPMLPVEREIWRQVHASGNCASEKLEPYPAGIESVACWAIHEPDWKREIMRSAAAEW